MSCAPSAEIVNIVDNILIKQGLFDLNDVINNFSKEKSRITAQLTVESEHRLQDLDTMMNKMKEANCSLQELKLNANKLDELRKDNDKSNQSNFKIFDDAMIVMKNIAAVENISNQMRNFQRDKLYVTQLIDEELKKEDDDAEDGGNRFVSSDGNNFLIAHYHLNQLRNFEDQLKDKASNSSTSSAMIEKVSDDIEVLTKKFDDLLECIVDNVYNLYVSDNFGYLIKTSKVIEFEEKEDLKVRVRNSLVKEGLQATDTDKILRTKERNYKDKFRKMLKLTIEDKISTLTDNHEDPYKACLSIVGKLLPEDLNDPVAKEMADSYYGILSVYRESSRRCAPQQWKLFSNVFEWCQTVIRNAIVGMLDAGTATDDIIGKIIHLNLDNKAKLSKEFQIPLAVVKKFSFLPEERKRLILNERLNNRKNDLFQHVQNLLKRDANKFRELCANGSLDGMVLNVAGPFVSLLQSHFGLCNKLHDESTNIEFLAFFASEIVKMYCDGWTNCIMDIYHQFVSGQGIVGFFPEQLSLLAVFFGKLADEIELKFMMKETENGIVVEGLNAIFLNKDSAKKIEEIRDSSIKVAIDITIDCLKLYAKITIHDIDALFDEIFTKQWYSDSNTIDRILKLIGENSFEPFRNVIEKRSNAADEVMHGLLDKFTDEFILRYLQSLNNRNKIHKKFDVSIERDQNRLKSFISYYGGEDIQDVVTKLVVFDFVKELILSNDYEQIWSEILESAPLISTSLLRIILECKKEKKIDSIVSRCEDVPSKNTNSREFDFLKQFTYIPNKK